MIKQGSQCRNYNQNSVKTTHLCGTINSNFAGNVTFNSLKKTDLFIFIEDIQRGDETGKSSIADSLS